MSAVLKFPTDPIVRLGIQYDALHRRIDQLLAAGEDEKADAVSMQMVAIEDQAAAMVPATAAGARAQLRIMRGFLTDYEWGEFSDQILDNLLAGLENIAEREADRK